MFSFLGSEFTDFSFQDMPVQASIYIVNVALNSFIILLDILVIWAAIRSREIWRIFVLHIIITAMVVDIAAYFNVILHDVPSYALNRDVSTPFLTKYCGYDYILESNYWYFNYEKPYTHLYAKINIVCQAVCVVVVVISDSLIVWKIFSLHTSYNKTRVVTISVSDKAPERSKKEYSYNRKRESRLALNFVLSNVCFLIMTVCFNIVLGEYSYNRKRESRLALNFVLSNVCFLIMTVCFNIVLG
ncbi:unnamed protein product, partial [Strongylus vulgaris]